jgi:hypothetical protein
MDSWWGVREREGGMSERGKRGWGLIVLSKAAFYAFSER